MTDPAHAMIDDVTTMRALTALLVGSLVVLSGCGTSKDAVAPEEFRPATDADAAALAPAKLFAADATDCSNPVFLPSLLDGIPRNIFDKFSCSKVMTPQEVSGMCVRNGVAGGGSSRVPEKLSHDRIRSVRNWGGVTECPGGREFKDQGSYEVTVKKVSGGWVVEGFKTLSGPGDWRVS